MMRTLHSTIWKRNSWVPVLCLTLLMCVSSARAEEVEADKPTANVTVDVLSQYVWRGWALSSDSAVIQPSMTASYKGFSLNVWGNLDTDESITRKGARWNETDITLSYSHELYKGLSGTFGSIYYALANSEYDSVEVFGGLSYAFPWLTVAVTGYREVSHYPAWWLQIDLSRNFPLPWCGMSIDLGTSFGYEASDDADYSTWQAGQVLAALNVPLGKTITISPRVGYAFPLSGEGSDVLEAGSWDGEDNHVFGGLRISASF